MYGMSYTHVEHILNKVKEYIEVPSVVGYEGPFVEYLQHSFTEKWLTTERMNNFLVVHWKKPNSQIISVHIDRHGVIKTGRNEYKYASFVVEKDWYHVDYYKSPDFLSWLYNEYVNEKVVAYDYTTGEELGQAYIEDVYMNPSTSQLRFTINGMDDLKIWTPLSYSLWHEDDVNNKRFSGQIDNVISVALVSYLYELWFEGTCLFTPEEEIGQSRSYIHYYMQKHSLPYKKLMVLDTCPFETDVHLNDGSVVLRNQDALSHFNLTEVFLVQTIANVLEIPWIKADDEIKEENIVLVEKGLQPKGLGITELGQLISHTNAEYLWFTIQIPTTWYHTNHETASYASIENWCKLVATYLWLPWFFKKFQHLQQQQ